MLGAASCSASSGGLQWRSMGSLRFMARSTARDRMRGSTYPRISIQKNRVMLARTLISLHAGGMGYFMLEYIRNLTLSNTITINNNALRCLRMNVTHFYNMYIGNNKFDQFSLQKYKV
ncbi:Protein of unknown function [Gryllus bimaculatus]|nr:Protein of unknown function [Gryllus bimaculatus]